MPKDGRFRYGFGLRLRNEAEFWEILPFGDLFRTLHNQEKRTFCKQQVMSNRDELIKQCRYYHGQEDCPYDDWLLSWCWDMERVYVMHGGKFNGESDYYKKIGGKTYPGIPFDLLMIMFTAWEKYTYGTADELNDFYKRVDDYLSIADSHYPKDKVPSGMPDELF